MSVALGSVKSMKPHRGDMSWYTWMCYNGQKRSAPTALKKYFFCCLLQTCCPYGAILIQIPIDVKVSVFYANHHSQSILSCQHFSKPFVLKKVSLFTWIGISAGSMQRWNIFIQDRPMMIFRFNWRIFLLPVLSHPTEYIDAGSCMISIPFPSNFFLTNPGLSDRFAW